MLQVRIPAGFDLDDLTLSEVASPPALARGQALVRMRAVSLNYRDIMVATGFDRWRPPVGRVPCCDGVGTVEQVGEGVTRFTPGETVLTTILPNWVSGPLTEEKGRGGLGGPARDGVLSELVVLDAEGLVRAPKHLEPAQAATLPTAGLTAWHALVRANALRSGVTVLTQGTGGVSLFALQLAASAGAKVIGMSSSAKKLDALLELGAAAVVNYREQPEWSERVIELADGRGVDIAIDVGGAATLPQSIRAVALGGTVSIVGILGGIHVTVDLAEVFQKNIRLDGIETGSRDMLERMIEWIEEHGVRPVVNRTFGFDEVSAAFKHLQSGEHIGKVCIAL